MKLKNLFSAFAAVSFMFGAVSCSDLSDIEDRIDVLESRVKAIENIIPALNANIEALKTLAGGGTINKVEEKDGVFTITLSNGETLTITQGSIGVANPPVMSIDKDGYWMVDYGNGAEYVLVGGNKVPATGADGITPLFSVDAEGYWTVSYDDGKTYDKVLDVDGKPVLAVPQEGADEYFAGVVLNGDVFEITLKNGDKVSLPVVPDFLFTIGQPESLEAVEGIYTLESGKTYIFPVSSKGVASSAVVSKPSRVEATLDGESLTLRALAATKVTADSRYDVAVLALSSQGFGTVAKVQVKVVGGELPDAPAVPSATLSKGEVTEYTLAFTVVLDNAASYRYILRKATEEAPDAETLAADGTESDKTSLLIEGLEPATEYVLYVLPVGTDGNGEIAYIASKTDAEAVPSAVVTVGTPAVASVEFTVALKDGKSYYWQVAEASAEAPTAESIRTSGTLVEVVDTPVSVTGLAAETAYKIYVLPVNGGTYGELVSADFTTAAPVYNNDYEKYMAGKDVVIAGIAINKTTHGDAILLTNESADKVIQSTGVYFVDPVAEGVTIKADAEKLVVASLGEKMATVSRAGQTAIVATSGTDYFILSNVKYVTSQTSGNVFGAKGDGDFETVIFNKVKIEIPADMNMLYSAKNILNFNMNDCDVKLHKGTAEKNIVQTNTTSTYQTLVFKNNIFYSTDGDLTGFRLFSNANATIASLEFRNNTVAGVYCKAAYGYITAKSVTAGDVVSNLFYVPDYTAHLDGKYVGILHIADKNDSHLNMPSNLAFYNYDAVPGYRIKCSYYSSNGTIYNKAKADNPIPSPDYANGVFAQGENYKSFGATR